MSRACCIFFFLLAVLSVCHSYVWEGKYQFLTAESIEYRFLNGTSLQFIENDDDDTARTWPDCYQCRRNEISLPLFAADNSSLLKVSLLFGADVVTSELGYSSSGSPCPESYAGFKSITLTPHHSGGIIDSAPPENATLRINRPIDNFFVAEIPEAYDEGYFCEKPSSSGGYDGYSCEHVQYAMSFKRDMNDGDWIVDSFLEAKNVVFGAFQFDETYCPTKIFHPCPPSEQCLIANGTLSCLPRDPTTSFPQDRSLIQPLKHCTKPAPQVPSEYELSAAIEGDDGLRLYSSSGGGSFLQASRYNFTINETTQVRFPSDNNDSLFFEASDSPWSEIFWIWQDEQDGLLERRLNVQFARPLVPSPEPPTVSWSIFSTWVYDNTEQWTEWNHNETSNNSSHRPIQVPANYTLFQCDYVEFNYVSNNTGGGQPARMIWEDLILGAFLLPNPQICELNIYHPCGSNQLCRAIDGTVTCVDGPLGGGGGDATPARSVVAEKRRIPGCVRIVANNDTTTTTTTTQTPDATPSSTPPTPAPTSSSGGSERSLCIAMLAFFGVCCYLL